jgi:two-component system sensor histidine kinase VanS
MRISFRTKVVALMTFGIIILFLIIGITFSITRTNELKKNIIDEANNFVELTRTEIGDAFVRYYETGFFRFREIVARQVDLSSDIENIQIVGLDKRIYFESRTSEKENFFLHIEHRVISDSFIVENIKKMEVNHKFDKNLVIVAPYINEYGVHKYSIVYSFSLERLVRGIASLHRNVFFLCIGIILIGFVISHTLSGRITSHLRSLSNVAEKIATGDFNQVVNITTNDEFEEVAKAFNLMTSEIRKDVRNLKNMVNELRRRDKERTLFLANLSHELRTPLTASLGYVDYMEKGKLGKITPEQTHSLAIIKRNLERLTREIRSLIDISKYSLRSIKLTLAPVSIPNIIEPVLIDFRPDIELKKLKVKTNYAVRSLPRGDRDYLKTVFENIFRNAIKFSPDGGVIGITTVDHKERNKKFVCFAIGNQGPMIPQKKLSRIFEPFYQIDRSTKKSHGGIGLGLSIARIIVEAHNGRIWAESTKEITVFKYIIPYGGKYVAGKKNISNRR